MEMSPHMEATRSRHNVVPHRVRHRRHGRHRLLPVHGDTLARTRGHGLAMLHGILTSILPVTIILSRQMRLALASGTGVGMSLISMLAMEIAMKAADHAVPGSVCLSLEVITLMLLAGFVTPLRCDHWRLKAPGKTCH